VLSECIDQEGQLHAFRVDAAAAAAAGPPSSAAPLAAAAAATPRLVPLTPRPLPMTGRSTCYIAFAPPLPEDGPGAPPRHAVVANYWDGVVDVVSLCPRTGAPRRVVQRWQQSRRPEWRQVRDRLDHMTNRQDGPHAHCAAFSPSGKWLFVPDLGDNGIHQYRWDARAAAEAARCEDAALARCGGGGGDGDVALALGGGASADRPLAPFSGLKGPLAHEAFVPLPPGDGPRHLVFHPRLPVAYSGCELRSRVQVFSVDEREEDDAQEGGGGGGVVRPRIAPVQSMSTLPDGWLEGRDHGDDGGASLQATGSGGSSSSSNLAGAAAAAAAGGGGGADSAPVAAELAAARLLHCGQGARRVNYVGEIRVSPDGRAVYASNRGHHSVAAFSVDAATGALAARLGVTPAGGACPRHFNLSPCGRWLVVGAQDSDAVAALARCPETGALAPLGDDHEAEEAAAAAAAEAAAAALSAAAAAEWPKRLAAAAERGRYVRAPCPNFVLFAPEHVVSAVSTPASSAQGGAPPRPLQSSSSGGSGSGLAAAAGPLAAAAAAALAAPAAPARTSGSGSASVRMSEEASVNSDAEEDEDDGRMDG
jgi:6-phosphogluconolactonase (cycloisomerase 2 family)